VTQPAHNVFSVKGEGYSLAEAAKLAGITDGLLMLWISTERFKPVELTPPAIFAEFKPVPFEHRRFVVTDANLQELRKLVETTRVAETAHKPGSNWTVKELAEAWGFSTDTIREWFEEEPGILMLERPKARNRTTGKTKRAYKTFTIPEAVAERVRRRRSL
jgi:hypothetical protein